MVSRPTVFDEKYKNLSTSEKLIQSDRDAMLYDLAYNTQNNTSDNISYTTNSSLPIIEDYYYIVDDLIKEDEELELTELDTIKNLKMKYAKLRMEKDECNSESTLEIVFPAVVCLLLVIDLIFICIMLECGKSILPVIILSILFILLGKIIVGIKKSNREKSLKEINNELKDLRLQIRKAENNKE